MLGYFFFRLGILREKGNALALENIKRRSAVRLPARAGFWSVVSGLVARGIGVVGTPIFTRLLTPTEYGLYPLYTTWLSVVSAIIISGLTGSAVYRGLQRFSGRKEEFVAAGTGLALSGVFILLILGYILSGELSSITGLSSGLLFALTGEAALSVIISFRSALLRYEYKYKSLALINISSAILTPVLSVLFVFLTPYHAEARVFGSILTALIIALPMLVVTLKRGGRLYSGEIWKYLIRVNIPLIPHYLSSSLILRASEMVIGRVHGQASLAKYSVAISVGMALTFVTNALTQSLSPWILRKISEGKHGVIKELITLAFGGLLAVTLFVLSVAPEILSVITPPEYSDALPCVYPLALSVSLLFLSNAIMSAEVYYEKSARSSVPTVITAIASILAALLILPRIDYRFSALFTLGAYIILVSLSALVFKNISGESIISTKKCTLLFAFSAAYALILFLTREALFARIALVLPLIPFLFIVSRRLWREIKER